MIKEIQTRNAELGTSAMLRRELHPQTTTPPEIDQAPANTLDFRSSDETLDRYQEIITVAGWKLDNYRRNPVVQNAHSYWSLADTIGKALITEVRTPSTASPFLFQRIQFAVEENPMAKVAYGLYKGGFLTAVSVGFIPLRWEDSPAPSSSSSSSSSSSIRRKYLEQELLEVSAVSIPANPNALKLGLREGVVEKGDVEELLGMLREVVGEESGRSDGAQWRRLSQELQEIRTILKRS